MQKLSDHPLVVGFMNEFVAYPALASQDCYGFRMESCSLMYRTIGDTPFGPHNGNGLWRFPGDSHFYHCVPGRAHSGLTRVVWEFNPVKEGQGGTLFVTASHKAVYTAPPSIQNPNSPLWDTYSCPAGSLMFFTEAITHSSSAWTNAENDRLAIFSCYNTVDTQMARLGSASDTPRINATKTSHSFPPCSCGKQPSSLRRLSEKSRQINNQW